MGVVYLARDEHLEREVAVKRIAIAHDLDGRGEREAIAAARLSHPGIVALYESGRDDEALYLVSELVRGRTLADLERDGELSDLDVLRIGVTLCGALEPAQARGGRIDGAADVYALGVVLYEALAGVNPVRAGNPMATARRVGMRLPPLGRVRRDLPAGLCRAIDGAVLPEPDVRTSLPLLRAALTSAAAQVSDVAGLIAGGDRAGLALPATRVHSPPGR